MAVVGFVILSTTSLFRIVGFRSTFTVSFDLASIALLSLSAASMATAISVAFTKVYSFSNNNLLHKDSLLTPQTNLSCKASSKNAANLQSAADLRKAAKAQILSRCGLDFSGGIYISPLLLLVLVVNGVVSK